MNQNGIYRMDYPDPDVIRVKNTYYMVTTTMHFMPGCEILSSYDLLHWEHVCYVYETLDSTPSQRLEGENHIYGKGMWAASLRFHKDTFYVLFVANDTRKTYLYQTKNILGTWDKSYVSGFYHDASLLFDSDDKVYLVYGNKEIWLTELEKDLSGPKENGLHRMILNDENNEILGYEGAHVYKIFDRYYVFLIHSDAHKWKRIQACFVADHLEGEFQGGDIFDYDASYLNQGIAQGGIVDTPSGDWYAMLFQDKGAIGRVPVLIQVTWKDAYPVFHTSALDIPTLLSQSTKPFHHYKRLTASDDFRWEETSANTLKPKYVWQWNHEPNNNLWDIDAIKGCLFIRTDKICKNLWQAVNTLTQRMRYPACEAYVTVNARKLKEGDFAGISAFIGNYAMIAITKEKDKYFVCMHGKQTEENTLQPETNINFTPVEYARIPITDEEVTLMVRVDFTNQKDSAEFFYESKGYFRKLGVTHSLYFRLDHFTGCRFGLFCYSTKQTGGQAEFKNFVYV